MKGRHLVAAVTLSMLIGSCSSTPKVKSYSLDDMAGHFKFRVAANAKGQKVVDVKGAEPFSADKTLLKKIEGKSESDIPEIIFSHYCNDGRQLRPLSVNIQAILGSSVAGQTLDTAQGSQSTAVDRLRQYAKSYFLLFDEKGKGSEDLARNSIDFDRWEKNEYTGTTIYQDKATVFGVTAKDSKQYVETVKQVAVSCPNDPNVLRPSSYCYGPTYISFPDKKELYLSLIGVPKFEWTNPKTNFGSPYMERLAGERQKGPILARVSPSTIEAVEKGATIQMRPLVNLYPLEVNVFAKHFTMLIPEQEQIKLFGEDLAERSAGSHDLRTGENSYGFFLKRKSDAPSGFNLNEAVKYRSVLWRAYIERSVQVSEAFADPVAINLEVSLDLGGFCRYGRPISSLAAK